MGNVLYRKYRSQSFDELVGQAHITETLKNAVMTGRLAHAYLFSGPRGVGKTSMARILAHKINELSPEDAKGHIDIIEIDAASNRRIDEIRDLREHVHTAPSQAKYKVYIIDEVHMLTKEAFNALLKTLEEPPEHAVFILATTEIHKIPETIISRTQRFTFKPVAPADMVSHLRMIADKESIAIDDAALHEIAVQADGSFRDAISLLDQIKSTVLDGTTHHISESDVLELVGSASGSVVGSYIKALDSADVSGILKQLQLSQESGHDAKYIAAQIYERMLDALRQGRGYSVNTIQLLKSLLLVPGSYSPLNSLEVAVLEFCSSSNAPTAVSKNQPKPQSADLLQEPGPTNKKVTKAKLTPKADDTEPKNSTEVRERVKAASSQSQSTTQEVAETATTSSSTDINVEHVWQEVLSRLKGRHNTLYGLARKVPTSLKDGAIVLHCSFPFHVKRLSDAQHNKILATTVSDIVGTPMKVTCVLDKKAQKNTEDDRPPLPAATSELDNISDIFGGAEVLES